MDNSEELANVDTSIEIKHKKEKKELQAHIQALKKTAKNDKSKKKELTLEISRLEIEMDNRHRQELELLKNEINQNNTCSENQLENEVSKIKISKAQKRRDKKALLDREREVQIKLQEKENLNGPRNKEIEDISLKLEKRNLKIFTIPSDGDCLYRAISHQLELTHKKKISAQALRVDAADYIRLHKEDFLPFMSSSDTFEMLTDEQFEQYCNKIAKSSTWGGQLEIRALSNSLKCPINIMQASGPECIEQGHEFSGPPLILTYHRHMYSLGEHYNSTCPNEHNIIEQ